MITLQAVGLPTSSYRADTALEVDDRDMDKYTSDDEPDNPITFVNPATSPTVENGKPLLFIYDCETTGGSHLRDHIMEVGSMVSVPDGVSISNAEFSSLCHTSLHITRQGRVLMAIIVFIVEIVSEKCGITARDLFNQPTFTTVFSNFVEWIEACVTEARQSGVPYYPGNFYWYILLHYFLHSSGST